ncbi:helicase SRCAP isoform X1 [Paralichthys olivaceus]|uniref:helicase SRCAP isoform X1 n=1 Tax=Paralichthys olivaceus TaxID=8255 RepID=UPI0037533BB0
MENAPPTSLPESLPISCDSTDSVSEEVAEVVAGARSLPTSLSSSDEMQRLPASLCPPLAPDTKFDSTARELQYGSQTDKEKSQSNCDTNQIQPLEQGEGLLAISEAKEKQFNRLEYKPETGTNMEIVGKEQKVGNILPQTSSQISTSSVPQPDADSTEHGAVEQSNRDSLVHANQDSHIPPSGAAWQADGHQDSKSLLQFTDSIEIKQIDTSETQPQIIKTISDDARELQKANSFESVETFDSVAALLETSNSETQPPSAEILETPEAREKLHGLHTSGNASLLSSDTAGREDGNTQKSSVGGEQVESSTREEQTDADVSSSDFTMLPENSSTQDSSSKPFAAPPLFDSGIVISLQAGQVVKAETSPPSDQLPTTETPLVAEPGDAQEIVVVQEEAHIDEDWSDMHLKQSYIVQREDGSVCEAAIVNELSSEPKLYEERVQADVEIDSQPVEVYEFCGLVEEVAEETVCASGSAQIPHSPGYEVNLFNALLGNSEEFNVKQDLEMHLGPSIHTVNDSDTLIISQQPLPSSHDTNQLQDISNSNSHNLSLENMRVADVRQHLVLDPNQAVQVANSSEVCVVEVAAVTSDSFTVEQAGTSAQIVTTCSQVSAAVSDQTEVRDPPKIQTAPQKPDTEATVGSLCLISPVVTAMQSSVAVSVHVSPVENQPSLIQTPGLTVLNATKLEACVSSHEGTEEAFSLTEPTSQSIQNVAMATETKPEAFHTSHSSSTTDPKLLLLKPGETSLLKYPSSFLSQVSKQQNVGGKLASTHGALSGSVSEECLPQTDSAADSFCASVALSSQNDQAKCSVDKTSVTAALPVKVQPSVSGNITFQHDQTPTNKSDKEALTVTKASTSEAVTQDNVTPTDATPPRTSHTLHMLEGSGERKGTPSSSPTDPISQPDSMYVEDESEDMDQDDQTGEADALEGTSGQVSSPEEGSDEEPDADKTESSSSSHKHGQSRTDRKALFLKVRQWIADRVTANSSPVSPSTSYPSPSPTSDWAITRREKSSPLRGPHGKFVSPLSVCGYSSSSVSPDPTTPQRPRGERHTDMAELAKHEADIEHRTQAFKREGFWSMKRLTRLTEPMRPKVHWDYLCEEMQWLSADFAQERRWKRGVARKVVRMVMRHHEELRQKEEKAKRDEHAKIRRVASSIAKEVRAFWSSVEKVVQYKQQSRLEEKRKKALDLQLDFIVGQTEKYSDLLSKSLAPTRPAETVPVTPPKSQLPPVDEDDRDFEPPCEEEDDEETIDVEEQQEGNDAESHRREIELLKEEGMLPLDQLLSTLKLPQESGSEEECSDETSSSVEEEDGEFTANEEDAEDEEDTIADQEKVEGNVNHAEELDDLAKEGDMTMEELLEKYKGAYASDFEAPSASGSKASSDSEVSGDEEEETEEDESDVESNTSSSDSQGDSAEENDSEKEGEENEEEEDGDDCGDEGMELLLKEGDSSPPSSSSRPKKEISHIAATAESLQPKGYTLATTKVKTPIPFLLHGTLREYQHIGLDWLVTMYEKKLNGILADEMGLGKTIQTIALLAHLACEKGNWGPHLIIVPTSVMLNWEMELKRWCPGFKILTYFGSQKERKLKRQGWTKPNAFHVCITSYKLVLQDHQAFRRKSWRYLILDEAQNIKNFKSQRWQSLLNFNSHRRLLLTGTPLQNSLMELWSLMHFLMPHVFQSHREFKEWFSNPLTGMIEGSQEYNEGLVKRLHKVLRPFLLRRIKIDVEKQMPKKYEHVVRCRLSKRQRFLYDDFMAQASTRETLASGHFMSVINILMQLRKVCNHPNLFDPRPIQSPFITKPIVFHTASLVQDALEVSPLKRCDLSSFDLVGLESRVSRYQADVFLPRHKVSRQLIQEIVESPEPPPRPKPVRMKVNRMFQPPPKGDTRASLLMNKPTCSVPPAAQTPKPPPVTELSSTPAPVVQQVVCSVASAPPPRPSMHPATQTAVRSNTPKPVLTVRPPTAPCTASIPAHPSPNPSAIMSQRVLLSPDMQARLPSGEVVSIAQLASLAGRPVSSCQGSKPVTFQLQGNKLTLSGAQIHQVPAAAPRPVQGNVMHLVSSGVQHHLISQPAQVQLQSAANAHPANTPSTAPPANRLPLNASAQVPSSIVSSTGVVKIVVRQSAGKEGGPVPTLAVAPSPRVAPQASPSLHVHASTTPVRNTAPLQIAQRTPGPATAHYTIAPPRNPSSTPNQPQLPRPVLKVVQPPPSSAEKPAPVTPSSSAPKSSATPSDNSSSSRTPATTKSRPSVKVHPPVRKVPRPPPRSPFHMSWLAESSKQQHNSRLDFIIRANEQHCRAKPMYGQEVLNFLTFLPGPRPAPAAVSSQGEWGRSGHSSCLFAQWQNKYDYLCQSRAVREAIRSTEGRLELLSDAIDRFTFAIPPVEAPPISMHCCHPPPSLSHKQVVFSSMLSTQVAPHTRSLHRIQCYMRTQFPDLRLIQYDCGKLQTLHTLLRKLKTGGHRVLIFTQMTRMLDVLEQFLNYHGHIYLRLDGSTRVEQRQSLMERFNADRRIFCFILSTRSGGVGVNLTGADTVVFYDSDWNPTMDAQAQDRCHRIGQTRDVHIYRLISERTVEENILKKANQKRMLGDMAIEGGNFTTAFFKQQTIRELFDMNEGEKREAAVELSVPQAEEEEASTKQSTTILEQALCRAEDEEDIVAASQAKAEQVAELAEFNENIPLDDGGEQEEVEELSKAEQEIAALVEQLTPIERYAMNFLEASLEDVCKEELKQAEEQVEAARKGLDQAKEEGLKLHASSDDDDDDFLSPPASVEPAQPAPARRGRKPKDKDKIVTSTRTSGRLRGASPETEPEPTTPREVPERPRLGLRVRGAAKDTGSVSTTPSRTDHLKSSSSTRLHDSAKSLKASSPARDNQTTKTRTLPNRSHPSPVPSPPTASPPGRKQQCAVETDGKSSKAGREEKEGEDERRVSESSLESSCQVDHQTKDDDGKDHNAMSPPSTSSRSPRKRQSADGEVLRGLVEDSPSAKVLRKLPGRLVTVVEDKEPRRRRRRGSGTGGGCSSEEATVEETTAGPVEESNKDNTSASPDGKTKGAVPQDQESVPNQSVPQQPVRSYPPYSPPHLSPDMPVLRNLPVRRRLETESRMAAQLVEQQQQLGRGRGGNQSRKTDTAPGKDAASSSAESNVNSLVTPLKRKRGRPPKTNLKLPEPDNTASPSSQPTSPSEEGNPPLSPKRKRGRPRKDSTTMSDTVGEGQNSKKDTATSAVSGLLKTDAGTELTAPAPVKSEIPKAAAVGTSLTSQSTSAEETDTNTEVSAPVSPTAPKPAPASTTKTNQVSTPVSAPVQAPPAPQATPPLRTAASTSAQTQVTATAPSSDSTSAHISSAPSLTLSTPAAVTASPATTTPAASTVSSSLPDVKPTLEASNAPKDPKPSGSTTLNPTEPDAVQTATVSTAVALTLLTTTVKAVTTTVKPVTTTKTTAANVLPQAPARPALKTITPTSVPASSLSASQKPTTTSPPTTATTTTTTEAETSETSVPIPTTATTTLPVKTVQTSPLNTTKPTTTAPTTCPAIASATPPAATVTTSSAPSSPAQTNVTTTKVPTKPVQAATPANVTTEAVLSPISAPAPGPVCTPCPTTSTSVVKTSEATTAAITSSPPKEAVKVTTPAEKEASSKEQTSASTAEKTEKITPSIKTDSEQAPQTETSVTVATTNTVATAQVSTTTTAPVPVTETKSAPPVSTSQTPAAISPQIQTSASKRVSTEVSAPAQRETPPLKPSTDTSSVSSEKQSVESKHKECASKSDCEVRSEEAEERSSKEEEEEEDTNLEICKSQPKRRKVESSSKTKESEKEGTEGGEKNSTKSQKEEPHQQVETSEEQETPRQKRQLSRQSSQESTRSSSPSSGGSTATLTRQAHHKRTYENRLPAKRRRVDVTSESGNEESKEKDAEKKEEDDEQEHSAAASRRRRSRSSSSSSDSDKSESSKEHRLTRSAKRRLQDQEKEKGNNRSGQRPAHSSERNASNNTNTSTGGESGSDTSSVRTTRKSVGSQSSQDSKTNSTPPPEPEVLGKRCSALNAAAKLLAMKGRVDTPGHTTRKDTTAKTSGTSPASLSDKNQKPKNKSVPASPQSNSVALANNRSTGGKQSTPNQSSRPASRSTRQCPGSLVPPLDKEYKRAKPEEKERVSRKSSRGKEGETEAQSLSRGHSACSSMSSDGEGDGGGSSRSRSSSNSSQRTHSISSQNTEHRDSRSRGASSGSERERDRSSDRAKRRDKKDKRGQQREGRQDTRRSQRLSQEVTSSSGTEGTPDRVLRSVAALAAVQARTPAASTRSSSSQQRHNKT